MNSKQDVISGVIDYSTSERKRNTYEAIFFSLATLVLYSITVTWQFSFIIVGVLFVHELSHVIAMKAYGMHVKKVIVTPMLGAAIIPLEKNFPTRKSEAYIAMAGPASGLLIIGICFLGYYLTTNPMWSVIAFFAATVNFMNILTIYPLDGGRVLKSIAYSIGKRKGIIMMGICTTISILMVILFISDIFLICFLSFILIIGSFGLVAEWEKKDKIPPLSKLGIFIIIVIYSIILIGLFSSIMYCFGVPGFEEAIQSIFGGKEISLILKH